MAKKADKPKYPKQDRTSQGVSVQAYIARDLHDRLRRFMAGTKRTLKGAIELALDRMLTEEGFPPAGDDTAGSGSGES